MLKLNLRTTRTALIGIIVVTFMLAGCAQSPDTPPVDTDTVEYTNYQTREFTFKIDVPTDWDLVEEEVEGTQYWDRVHISPPGYESDRFPHLLSIDTSAFSFDQNYELFGITNTLDEIEDIDYGDFRALKLFMTHRENGSKSTAYMLEFISGQTIILYLRSDDPEYIAILDHMWESFDSLR